MQHESTWAAAPTLNSSETVHDSMQAPESVCGILKPVVALYAMKVIETNLGWYLSEGLLSMEVGAAVPQHIRYSKHGSCWSTCPMSADDVHCMLSDLLLHLMQCRSSQNLCYD